MTDHRSVYVVCPFYIKEDGRSITCEGITDKCNISLHFRSPRLKKQHHDIFCAHSYACCEVCRMLLQKYEED